MAEESRYDCIVIGAGMAGLTVARLLARHGRKVLAVEQHYLPGGLFSAFKRRSYLFNVGLEWITDCAPGQNFHDLLKRLGVAGEYRFQNLSIFKTIRSPELGEPLEIPCDTERLRRSLASRFPGQSGGIDRFLSDCLAVAENPERARTLLVRTGRKPVEAMLEEYFDDPLLVHALFSLISYPSSLGVLLMYLVAGLCRGRVFVPEHWDHRRLAVLLHRGILAAGGEVLYRTKAERILLEDGAARGVRLASGREVHAPLVIAGLDARELYLRLLPELAESERAQEMAGRRPGLSTFSLFLGLDGDLDGAGPAFYSRALLAPTASWRANPAHLSTVPLRVECQSALHPHLAPAGKSTLCVWAVSSIEDFGFWGQGRECDPLEIDRPRYEAAKSQAADTVLNRLEAVYPGLRGRIEVLEAATPFTVKSYTRNHAGSVTGHSLTDLRYLKPASFATPVRGLYHVGHWTVQSGVGSVMGAAAWLADLLLAGTD